jgi:hypothetical protein
MSKVANGFRIENSLFPLYLGAENEAEFSAWVKYIAAAKERCEMQYAGKFPGKFK